MPDLFAPTPRTGASSNCGNVKRWVRDLFVLADEATVMVTELRCSEAGCPPLETVIAILSVDGNRQYKMHKPMAEVTQDDLRGLAAHAEPSNGSVKWGKGEN